MDMTMGLSFFLSFSLSLSMVFFFFFRGGGVLFELRSHYSLLESGETLPPTPIPQFHHSNVLS
jgi:hypothetical protein